LTAGLVPAVFVLLWSTGFIGAKLGLPHAEPLTFLSLRFALVASVLAVICVLARAPWPKTRGQVMHIAVAGLLVQAGYLGGVFSAIALGLSAGAAALIVGAQPLLTACLARPLLAERIAPVQWAGFALGLVGVVFVLGPAAGDDVNATGATAPSLAFAFIGLASITAGTLYQKRFAVSMDLRSGSLIQFLAASALLAPLAWATESMQISWTGEFVFALGWLALVLSLGAITLLNLLIRRGAASRVASLFYLTPGVTAVIAWAVFDERLALTGIVGLALAAIGVALVNAGAPAAPARYTSRT